MAKKIGGNVIGGWAFLVGVVLAVIFGFQGVLSPGIALTLAIIGVIVGLLNITSEETNAFLLSGVVLIIAGGLGGGINVPYINSILDALLVIFVPATIIVAIKNVMSLARH